MTQSASSTAKTNTLIAFPLVDAYQCPRCRATIEVPKFAVLAGGAKPVRLKLDPLNHLLWLEEQAAKHTHCRVVHRVWRSA